ncbi:hypothetical protein AYX13_01858 [Cryptococcus neoformans]|nr:hypothetical protein AYX13_01858 [Cryptococcus neoformans var. grubii]
MLKDIVERTSSPAEAPKAPAPSSTGFPVAVHRSQRPSAFARARRAQQALKEEGKQEIGYGRAVDTIPSVKTAEPASASSMTEWEEVKKQVQEDNSKRVQSMSPQEREEEIKELRERLGDKKLDLLRRRAEARQSKRNVQDVPKSELPSIDLEQPFNANNTQKILQEVSEENARRVRLMSFQEREQETEELRERFGDKIMEALRKRAEVKLTDGKNNVVERTVKPDVPSSSIISSNSQDDDMNLGVLKAKYFPTLPSEPSKLEWLQPISAPSSNNSIRFDLSGIVLSAEDTASLPTHLGLHHHGESPGLAGYTLQDILYLCRSTVPSQRITMMGVLSRILGRLRNGELDQAAQTECDETQVVQKAIELGVEVLAGLTRGTGVIRASVELLFEALRGPSWVFPDDSINADNIYQPFIPTLMTAQNDPTGIASIPFEDVLPRLTELLSIPDALPVITTDQLLLILRRTTFLSGDLCETICPIVPVILKHHVIQRPWPPKGDNRPNVEGLALLRDITASSRACAEDLLSQRIYESTLKFVVSATWSEGSGVNKLEIGQNLALEVLRIYAILGRYGLSASIVASSSEVWRLFGKWVQQRSASETLSPLESSLIRAYFDLLKIWVTCAIDPHRTTPEHDITWAQVMALDWIDEAVSSVKQLLGRSERLNEVASALDMLVSWATGAKVNGIKGGEEEKKTMLAGLKTSGLTEAIESMRNGGEDETRVLCSAVRLHSQLHFVGELLSKDTLAALQLAFLVTNGMTVRSVTYLRYELLRLSIQSKSLSPSEWLPVALDLFLSFDVGDEPLALDLVDDILKADWSSAIHVVSEQYSALSHPDKLQILRPLLHYTILPDVENVVSPSQPSHVYLKATSTLRAPPTSLDLNNITGLPLQPDWLFSPLNELLRSGTSIALSQVPSDWSASETEIVQSVLFVGQLQCASPMWTERLGRNRLLFNLMKVFMLEHGQQTQTPTSEGEVFRDSQVAQGMTRLMEHLTNPLAAGVKYPVSSLETVALPFLTAGVPFFQFYTDFLALYEAISFSDMIFTQLLLPPLAMSYPSDYRKLLWNDHSTALRGMRVRLHQVPLEDGTGLDSYFAPKETSNEVLSGYARALTRGWVVEDRNEFLFRVASHHLAELFWRGVEEAKESHRVGLMVGILSTGTDGLVKRLLEWDLETRGERVVGPQEKQKRKEAVGKLTGTKGSKRVESL